MTDGIKEIKIETTKQAWACEFCKRQFDRYEDCRRHVNAHCLQNPAIAKLSEYAVDKWYRTRDDRIFKVLRTECVYDAFSDGGPFLYFVTGPIFSVNGISVGDNHVALSSVLEGATELSEEEARALAKDRMDKIYNLAFPTDVNE